MNSYLRLLLLVMYLILNSDVNCTICEISSSKRIISKKVEYSVKSNHREISGNNIDQEYSCPQPNDPPEYNVCCQDDENNSCCPIKPTSLFNIGRRTSIIIAVTVSLSAAVVVIPIIICLLWSKCPLYSKIRVNYSSDLTFGTQAGPQSGLGQEKPIVNMKAMPPEGSGEKVFFWPKFKVRKAEQNSPIDI